MSKASANRALLAYKAETAWGETPVSGGFTQLRYTGESLDRDKNTATSAFIRSDRMIDDAPLLGFGVQGDVDVEMVYGDYDTLIEHLLGSTFNNLSITTLTLTVAAGAKTITRSAGSWISDAFLVGGAVTFSGFSTAGNNKRFIITAMTALVLTVADPLASLVNETSGAAACTAAQKAIKNGTTENSLVIEKQFQDISKYMYFNGLRVSAFSLDLIAQQLITGKFSFMGKDAVAGGASIAGSVASPTSNASMSASANVGSILYSGTLLSTGLKSIKFSMANNLRKQDVVAQQATGGIAYGSIDLKGSIEAYFEDLALVNDVIAHTTVGLCFPLIDLALNRYDFNFPSIKLTKGSPMAGKINEDIIPSFEFSAIRNAAANAEVVISK
jgi:hypothetical protein